MSAVYDNVVSLHNLLFMSLFSLTYMYAEENVWVLQTDPKHTVRAVWTGEINDPQGTWKE